ncbi:hypothetical protein [Haloterrigena alkaliphila]|uniref:Uncharacterized protein n=1 Tax=Haloterrigena alkaliphila TaxID=2816475 RepID=A0A8A2VD07_9EURY|nr:hypothetical protein [Haloterrigena alkaliphila]QSW98577.1 hypothetical protein J0X25_14420 [Haloterrigena alkaliphila]
MSWQDLVFLCGSLLTVVALLPTLRNANARIPLGTSVPKLTLAVVYTATFHSLGMTFSAVGLLGTAVAWSLVAYYRSPSGRLSLPRSRPSGLEGPATVESSSALGHDGDRL